MQSGFGRTGKMFAVNHTDTTPDILVVAKGIASGYPLSGLITRKDLSDQQLLGSMGGTFGGNAVACAAALGTLQVFREENVLENCNARGEQLRAGLSALRDEFPFIVDVRGAGLMCAVEYDRKVVGQGFAGKVSAACVEEKLLVLPTSVFEVTRFIPPLTISEGEVDEALTIYTKAVRKALA